jgi:hypothetical protein
MMDRTLNGFKSVKMVQARAVAVNPEDPGSVQTDGQYFYKTAKVNNIRREDDS